MKKIFLLLLIIISTILICNNNINEENFGYDVEDFETLVIDLEGEDGNTISCPLIDQFEYEEKVYVLAQNPEDDSVYMFRVEGEGEDEELVVPEEEEFDRVAAYYNEVLVDSE